MSEQDKSTESQTITPWVFISYSHDSLEHQQRVRALAERLRDDGVDAQLDQYVVGTPPRGWPRWMLKQLDSAQFVLVVCTETYYRRFRGREEPDKGKGADWEGSLITLELYDARSDTSKFVPVLFEPQDEPFIPEPVSGHTHYLLNSEDNYAKLYAFLTGQAGVMPRKLGRLKTLAREPVEPLTFGGPVEGTPPAGKLDRLPGYVRQKTGSDAFGDSQNASASESLTLKDNRLHNPNPRILEIIPYPETPTVDELLDRIRRSLTSPPKVPDPGSYGRQWMLYSNGHYFHDIGRRWAQFIEGKQLDQRPLRDVGIKPGMTLEVHPPKQATIIVNPRPFLGAGAEILEFIYAELKDVDGFLNRIESCVRELSAESYGREWILFDPANGQYFHQIRQGNTQALADVGVKWEEGDRFLHVRRPRRPTAGPGFWRGIWHWWIGLKTELKVPVIAGLFTIVVAIVTGICNLGVAIYNGFKASPTPVVSAAPMASSTPPGVTPDRVAAPPKPAVRADIVNDLKLAHDPKNKMYQFAFNLRLRNTGTASEQIIRYTSYIDVPDIANRKYTVSEHDFSFWQGDQQISGIPVIPKESSEIVTCKITLWETPEFTTMFNDSTKRRELFLQLFGEEKRAYSTNFSFDIGDGVRQMLEKGEPVTFWQINQNSK